MHFYMHDRYSFDFIMWLTNFLSVALKQVWCAGGENVVDWDFTLNELVPGEPLIAPVQALRCDGHQHAGMPSCHLPHLMLQRRLLVCCSQPVLKGSSCVVKSAVLLLLCVAHIVLNGRV